MLDCEMIDVLRREELVVAELSAACQANVLDENRIASHAAGRSIFNFDMKEPRSVLRVQPAGAAIA